MKQTNKNTKSQKDVLKQADQLFAKIKKANNSFIQKTDDLIKDIDQDIEVAEKEINEVDKNLKKFEKEAVNKIDKAVLEFVAD